MSKFILKLIFILFSILFTSCIVSLEILDAVREISNGTIEIMAENRTDENIEICKTHLLAERLTEKQKILARSVKKITVIPQTSYSATGEKSKRLYSSKSFGGNSEVWIIE